jgi:hypothetical protein
MDSVVRKAMEIFAKWDSMWGGDTKVEDFEWEVLGSWEMRSWIPGDGKLIHVIVNMDEGGWGDLVIAGSEEGIQSMVWYFEGGAMKVHDAEDPKTVWKP